MTIVDVAKHAGVSIATVSRVLNQPYTVAPETAQRVRAAIAHLSYRPRAAARGLASGRSYAIGLITDTIAVPFFAPLLQGIEDTARQHNFNLLIHCARGGLETDAGFDRPLGPHNTDGLLVFAGALCAAELEYLCAHDFPLVLLYQTPPNSLPIPCVLIENRESARQLVEHLIVVHGHRRIAFLKGPETQEDSYQRELGYREALARHSITIDETLVAIVGHRGSGASEAVARWLRQGQQIDAIFAWDDDTALEVIRALQLAGRRVPEDIAVVGFDDIHLAYYAAPPLTTVRTPVEQVGREAVRQLVQRIITGQAAPVTVLPTELVIRRSCGCNHERG
ncbi:MAG: LacI family DNA-binding transcriptional regulator [Anaerolineae bacterium]